MGSPYAEGGSPDSHLAPAPGGRAPDYLPSGESQRATSCIPIPLVLISSEVGPALSELELRWPRAPYPAGGEPASTSARADATAQGISDGDWIKTVNDRGSVRARARVGDRVAREPSPCRVRMVGVDEPWGELGQRPYPGRPYGPGRRTRLSRLPGRGASSNACLMQRTQRARPAAEPDQQSVTSAIGRTTRDS